MVIEAAQAARRHGTIVSYDLNYRPSLWKGFGGIDKCREINRDIAEHVDVMIGNEEDFTACLGFEVDGVDANLTNLDTGGFERMIEKAVAAYPNFKATATTLRGVKTATLNDWGAMCWMEGAFHNATQRPDLEIMDRVGGGDSFASGFIYGLMELQDPRLAVEYGAAHGALAMTTPGDTTMATLAEVQKLVGGGGARVDR
jgi:2-dehydro-3-deoxygluconokinase